MGNLFDKVKGHFTTNDGDLPAIEPRYLQELIDGCQPDDEALRKALEEVQRCEGIFLLP